MDITELTVLRLQNAIRRIGRKRIDCRIDIDPGILLHKRTEKFYILSRFSGRQLPAEFLHIHRYSRSSPHIDEEFVLTLRYPYALFSRFVDIFDVFLYGGHHIRKFFSRICILCIRAGHERLDFISLLIFLHKTNLSELFFLNNLKNIPGGHGGNLLPFCIQNLNRF